MALLGRYERNESEHKRTIEAKRIEALENHKLEQFISNTFYSRASLCQQIFEDVKKVASYVPGWVRRGLGGGELSYNSGSDKGEDSDSDSSSGSEDLEGGGSDGDSDSDDSDSDSGESDSDSDSDSSDDASQRSYLQTYIKAPINSIFTNLLMPTVNLVVSNNFITKWIADFTLVVHESVLSNSGVSGASGSNRVENNNEEDNNSGV